MSFIGSLIYEPYKPGRDLCYNPSMKSKAGFHSGPTGNMTGIGDFWRNLDSAGIPIFHKATDGYGPLFEISNLPNPHNIQHNLVYRISTAGQDDGYDYDVPPYHMEPGAAALHHWNRTRSKLPSEFNKQKVWIEVANEIDKDRSDWIGRFGVAIATIANGQGYKVVLPGWSSGEPEVVGRNDWETQGLLLLLQYCAAHMDVAAISVHEYDFNMVGYDNVYPYQIGRFQWIFDTCDRHGIARPNIFITEWGWARNFTPAWANAEPNITKCNQLYCRYPQIKGYAIWHLGGDFGDVGNQTQRLIAPLGVYTLTRDFPGGSTNEPLDPLYFENNPTPIPPPTSAENIFKNPSFEGGWWHPGGVPELQTPVEWEPFWITGANPHDPSPFVRPEYRVLGHNQLPPTEWETFIIDGVQTVKIFKGSGCFQGGLKQIVSLVKGKTYGVVVKTVPDIVVRYEGGRKVFAAYDPNNPAARVRVTINGAPLEDWYLLRPSNNVDQYYIEFSVSTTGQYTIAIEYSCVYPFHPGNNIFVDDVSLRELEEEDMFCFPPQKEIVMLVPQTLTPTELATLTDWAYNGIPGHTRGTSARHGFWFAHTTAINTVMAGLPTSELYIVDGDRIGTGLDQAWLQQNCPEVLNTRTVKFISLTQASTFKLDTYPLIIGQKRLNQDWCANPEDYIPFGLPGHEGFDLYAPSGTKVVAPKAGVVYMIHTNPTSHNYGLHVRLDHGNGHKTIYAHLSRIDVVVGQSVGAGVQIGLSGNTGNSTGPHLHFSYKRDGRTYVDECGTWPSNLHDPSPIIDHLFTSTPPTPVPPVYSGPPVTYTPVIHAPGSDWMWNNADVKSLIARLNLPVKFMTNGSNKDVFAVYNKPAYHLVRVFWQPNAPKTPQQAWSELGPDIIEMYGKGARNFELLNEPNLPGEGMGVVWQDGNSFGVWLKAFIGLLKTALPAAKLWYPGLSPGVPWTNQFVFTDAAWSHVKNLCYGVCVHAYTGNTTNVATAVNDIVTQVLGFQQRYALDRPLVVSECSVNRGFPQGYNPTAAELHNLYQHKADVYKGVDLALKTKPGVQGVVYYISKWDAPPEQVPHRENWVGTELPDLYLQ